MTILRINQDINTKLFSFKRKRDEQTPISLLFNQLVIKQQLLQQL